MMRKLTIGLAAAAAVALLWTAAGLATAGSGPSWSGSGSAGSPAHSSSGHLQRANPCAANTYGWYEGGSHDYMAGTWWSDNDNNCWQQSALRCHNRNGTEHWFHGGMVTPEGKESGVNCDVNYPEPDQLNINFQQWPVANSYYYKCVWSC